MKISQVTKIDLGQRTIENQFKNLILMRKNLNREKFTQKSPYRTEIFRMVK